MSSRLDSLRIATLVAFLTVVGVAGSSTGEAVAQETAVLARARAAATTVTVPRGADILIAIGSLQLIGVLMFEGIAFLRRRSERRGATPALAWPVPTPYTFQAPESTSRTPRAA
jgi:hypothetical protein